MKSEIAKEIHKIQPKNLYIQAAEKFNSTYDYVIKIAGGRREPTKKKGKLIKEWLLQQIELSKTSENN